MTDKRRFELLEAIKYDPNALPKANFIFIFIRSISFLHSLYLKIKMFISRNIYTQAGKKKFIKNKELFVLNKKEEKHVMELRENGITIIEDHFSNSLLDKIAEKANLKFEKLDISKNGSYNASQKRLSLSSLEDMSYEELALTEVFIGLNNPLVSVEELVDITFEESLLKIISNYLGYIPTHTSSMSRAFPKNPPVEPSFFHKDSRSQEVLHTFIYLNDVDEDGGPFCYAPKSHNNSIMSCKPRTSADMNKVDSYGRISDEEMKKYYPEESWFPVKGKKGTIIIVDANGLHKGPMWSNKPIEDQHHRDIIDIHCRSRNSFNSFESGSIPKESTEPLSHLQKLFLSDYKIV